MRIQRHGDENAGERREPGPAGTYTHTDHRDGERDRDRGARGHGHTFRRARRHRSGPAHRTPRHPGPRRPHRTATALHGHVPPGTPRGHRVPARPRRDRPAHPHRLPHRHGARPGRRRTDERPVGEAQAAAPRHDHLRRRHRDLCLRPHHGTPHRLPPPAGPGRCGGDRHRPRRGARHVRRRGDGQVLLHTDADLRRRTGRRAADRRTGAAVHRLAGDLRRPHRRRRAAHPGRLEVAARDPATAGPAHRRHRRRAAHHARAARRPGLHAAT